MSAAFGSDQPIKRIAENVAYRNRFITVYDDQVAFADGSTGSYLRIVESGGRPGVAMLALASGHVALVRTYRYSIGGWEWGIPRGLAHGDDPEASARAELAEELGQEPDELIEITRMTPNSGLLASVVHLFLAHYRTQVSEPTDRDEVAEVRWIPAAALMSEVASGRIVDGFTLAAVGCGLSQGIL